MTFSLTLVIIIVTSLISYQALNNASLLEKLKHYPYEEKREKEWYRILTGGFVHGSIMHLAFNMYVLYIFGEFVENFMVAHLGAVTGRILFVVGYLLTIIFASLPTYMMHSDNPTFASVGASGAVSGILFIFIMINPWSTLLLFFIIPMPAIVAGIGYLIYSSWASKNQNDRIDHVAHFYGAVFGILFIIVVYPDVLQIFMRQIRNLPF